MNIIKAEVNSDQSKLITDTEDGIEYVAMPASNGNIVKIY